MEPELDIESKIPNQEINQIPIHEIKVEKEDVSVSAILSKPIVVMKINEKSIPQTKTQSFENRNRIPQNSPIQSSQYQQWKNSQMQGMNLHALARVPPQIISNNHMQLSQSSATNQKVVNVITAAAARKNLISSVSPEVIKEMAKAQMKYLKGNDLRGSGPQLVPSDMPTKRRAAHIVNPPMNSSKVIKLSNNENASAKQFLLPTSEVPKRESSTIVKINPTVDGGKNAPIYMPSPDIAKIFSNEQVIHQSPVVEKRKRGRPSTSTGIKKATVRVIKKIDPPKKVVDSKLIDDILPVTVNLDSKNDNTNSGVMDVVENAESNASNTLSNEIQEYESSRVEIITAPDTGQIFTVRI